MKLTLRERLAFRFIFSERRVYQRWYGRFLVFGIDYGRLRRVVSRIDNWLDWCREWRTDGAELEQKAHSALEKGHLASATALFHEAVACHHIGQHILEDGQRFRAFRHLSQKASGARAQTSPAVFVVRFKFARFSQSLNRLLSLAPVPLIGGFPGFRHKLWMVEEETGCWQGAYEWESAEAVESYRRSLVFRAMNRRAAPGSVSCTVIPQTRIVDYLNSRAVRTKASPATLLPCLRAGRARDR